MPRRHESLRFFIFSNPAYPISIKAIRHPKEVESPWCFSAENVGSDYVLLETEDIPSPFPGVKLNEPKIFSDLILFAYQRNIHRSAEIQEQLNNAQIKSDLQLVEDGSWTRFVRYDAAATCAVAEIRSHECIVHACQTEFGTSGAPLFLNTQDDLELIGVHSRHMSITDQSSCAGIDLLSTPNVGVRIGDDHRQIISDYQGQS